MKKEYVRPTMESEVFVTNAYCGACSDMSLPNTLIVDLKQGNWYSNNWGKKWNGDKKKFVTYHEFSEASKRDQVSNGNGQPQYYWTCSCCNGQYYLEYSAHYTDDLNGGNPTFFLYKETTGDNVLQLGRDSNWPAKVQPGIDQMVAQVKFSVKDNAVVNS